MAGTLYDEALEHLEPNAPSQPTSLYEEARATIADLDQAQESGLRRSLRVASETTPDRAAEARRLSLRLGVPSALVERHLDDFPRRATVEAGADREPAPPAPAPAPRLGGAGDATG